MSRESRRLAGILLVVFPSVIFVGALVLALGLLTLGVGLLRRP